LHEHAFAKRKYIIMSKIASTILMIRPASFGYNEETAANNVFQTAVQTLTQHQVQEKALKEFDSFIDILRKNDIEVIVVDDTILPTKPDAIFPNNWFCTLDDGTVALFPMFAPNRRLERRNDLLDTLVAKYRVKDVHDLTDSEAQNIFLEGTGSMIIDQENKIIYACLSPRTDEMLLRDFSNVHHYKIALFHARDENGTDIYHTNVIMHLGEDYAVVCLESITDQTERNVLSQTLIATGHKIIPVTLQQVHAYAGNMLQVKNKFGKKFTILSNSAFLSLTQEQKQMLEAHTQLMPVDITTIETIGGGSVRCMMAEIFLDKK
jgi:hypothetical protein